MTNNIKLTISNGNKKMGQIKSVSLPPVITCAPGCTCAKKCYANKLCRIYPTVKNSYFNNLEFYKNNSLEYFTQIERIAKTQRFFRWHVAGDIVNNDYFNNIVNIANNCIHTDFLIFTKKYDIINTFLDDGGIIPQNLHVIFSAWDGMTMDNKYNLPISHVIFKGEKPLDNWNICPGNCLDCAIDNKNCWALKNGQHVAFYEH